MNNLEQRVKQLEDIINSQESANTIPLKLDQALNGRGYMKSSKTTTGGTATQSITISGTPATIIVPAQPTGTVSVLIEGKIYNLLFV